MMYDFSRRKKAHPTIKKIYISFEDGCYIYRDIELDGHNLSYRNSISPTIGYESFPKGYFETKTTVLTDKQLQKLLKCINTIYFNDLNSNIDINNIGVGLTYEVLTCKYSDGSEFELFTTCHPKPLRDIFDIFKGYCNFEKSYEEIQLINNPIVITGQKETLIEIQCQVCNRFYPDGSQFCPYCGKEINSAYQGKTKENSWIFSETVSWCSYCGLTNRFEYQYCCYCGKKLKV